MARGVAILGVKVTGIEPPRLTFVTVYRIPIRLPAKSALTWPVVSLVAYKPSHQLLESLVSLTHKQSLCTGYLPATPILFIFVRGQTSCQHHFYVQEVQLPLPTQPYFCPEVRLPLFLFSFFLQRKCVRQESNPRLTFVTVYRRPIRRPASQR